MNICTGSLPLYSLAVGHAQIEIFKPSSMPMAIFWKYNWSIVLITIKPALSEYESHIALLTIRANEYAFSGGQQMWDVGVMESLTNSETMKRIETIIRFG